MAGKLNEKQIMFCREYIVDLNATQAAERSGYSKKTARSQGQRLLTHVDVQEKITKLKADRSKSLNINAEYVLTQAVKLHERCMQEEPVLDKEGNEIGEYKFEHAGAAKSLEIIGKHVDVQAFLEKSKVEATITHEQWLDTLE